MASMERFKFRGLSGIAGAALLLSGCAVEIGGGAGLGQGAPAPASTAFSSPLAGSLPLGGSFGGAPGGTGFGPAAPGSAGGTTTASSAVGAQIKQAAENLPDPFPYAPGTQNGNLGCADVVTTALADAGVIDRSEHNLAVKGTMTLLEGKGWNAINPPPYSDGDVICWDPMPGGRHMHIGIIVVENGEPYAIHNSSSQRRVVKVPLSSMNRDVNTIYRHPQSGVSS